MALGGFADAAEPADSENGAFTVGAAVFDWPQDGGNAQRTGWTPEEPRRPWKFAWTWNGPDSRGGAGGHRYHQPVPHQPWEARVIVAGGLVFVPAGIHGIYALRVRDGQPAWQFKDAVCHATPVYDAGTHSLLAGTLDGRVIRLQAGEGVVAAEAALDGLVTKSLLLAGATVYALTEAGRLHALDARTLVPRWVYDGGSGAATLPAWSERHQLAIFATVDLHVHAVHGPTGLPRWRVKPTPLEPRDGPHSVEFTGGWPVVAERHELVFVRLVYSGIDFTLWSGGGPKGRWPTTNAAIRERLRQQPHLQSLFALRLADGQPALIPAVGPAGVEDLAQGRPRLRVPGMPVVRTFGDQEVAFLQWRNGQIQDPDWDGRWDSHLGEMVLDDKTVPGFASGDVRFVQFVEHGGWMHITDESCPLSMAGPVFFYAHWDASTAARLIDRSPTLGHSRQQPIKTEKLPPVVRHLKLPNSPLDFDLRWHAGGLPLVDGRWLDGPGWWVYANTLDPPTPARDAYSEGILPRYTLVAHGLVLVQGNGGDLFALRHHDGHQ